MKTIYRHKITSTNLLSLAQGSHLSGLARHINIDVEELLLGFACLGSVGAKRNLLRFALGTTFLPVAEILALKSKGAFHSLLLGKEEGRTLRVSQKKRVVAWLL